MNRQEWLQSATDMAKNIMKTKGITIPEVRVGFAPLKGKSAGICFIKSASYDDINEIFIDTEKKESEIDILGVLVHELIHASSNNEEKHGLLFKEKAVSLGLGGKMKSTVITDDFKDIFEIPLKEIGPFDYGMMRYKQQKFSFPREARKRLICDDCGYEASVKESDHERGILNCPCCNIEMEIKKKKGDK